MAEHSISVVVPVYQGEAYLRTLVKEIEPLTTVVQTPAGHSFRVREVILVHDCGPDDSASVMRALGEEHDWVTPVWLSRNFGQHAATIAGMASSAADWIVTMDEDGQHDPADIASLLDVALRDRASLVYARPLNEAPHAFHRRVTSSASKRLTSLLSGGTDVTAYHSFRLILGELGRSVAAYAGHGVYLDVALGWVAPSPSTAPVTLRSEGNRQSGYNLRSLLSHFRRMIVTSGTRALRMASIVGILFALAGLALAVVIVVRRLAGAYDQFPGWSSLMVVTLVCAGAILIFLGVIAEYLGAAVNMAMGKPLYLITTDPANGPLGRVGVEPSPAAPAEAAARE